MLRNICNKLKGTCGGFNWRFYAGPEIDYDASTEGHFLVDQVRYVDHDEWVSSLGVGEGCGVCAVGPRVCGECLQAEADSPLPNPISTDEGRGSMEIIDDDEEYARPGGENVNDNEKVNRELRIKAEGEAEGEAEGDGVGVGEGEGVGVGVDKDIELSDSDNRNGLDGDDNESVDGKSEHAIDNECVITIILCF